MNKKIIIKWSVLNSCLSSLIIYAYKIICYQNHHHHHVMLLARISLTLSLSLSLAIRLYHPSLPAGPLDYILCPYWWVLVGRPTHARPCEGVHRKTSLMSSSLLLHWCSSYFFRRIWMVLEMWAWWLYCCCFWYIASLVCSIWLVAFLFRSRLFFLCSFCRRPCSAFI